MSANPSLRLDEPLLIDEIVNTQQQSQEQQQPAQQPAQQGQQKQGNAKSKKFSSQDFPPLSGGSSTYRPVAVQWGKNIKPASAPSSSSSPFDDGALTASSSAAAAAISSNSFPSLSSINGGSPSPIFSANGSSSLSSSASSNNNTGFAKNKKIQQSFSLDSSTQLNIAKSEFSKIVLSVKSNYKVSVESTIGRNGRTFLISGLPNDVSLARRDLVKKLTKPVAIQIQIPTKTKSAIIGQGGKTIREIIDTYNVKIDVSNEDLGSESYDEDLDDTLSLVTINGDLEGVQHTKERITSIINEVIKNLTIRIPIDSKVKPFVEDSDFLQIVEGVESKVTYDSSKDQSFIVLSGPRESVKSSKLNVLSKIETLNSQIIEKTVPVMKKLQFTINAKDIKENFHVLVTFLNDSAVFSGMPVNVDSAIEYARNISKKYIIETLEISKAHNKNLEHAKNLGLYFYKYQTSFLKKFSGKFPNVQLMFMSPEQLASMETVSFKFSSLSDYQNELKLAKKYLIQLVSNLPPSKIFIANDLDFEIFGKEMKKILSTNSDKISFVQLGDYFPNNDILLLIKEDGNDANGKSADGEDEEEDDDDFDFKPSDEENVSKLSEINSVLNPLREKQASLFTQVLDLKQDLQTDIFIKSKETENLILQDFENLQIKLATPSADQLTLRGEEKSVKQVAKTIESIVANPDLNSSSEFEVPTKTVSHLIGSRGNNLNSLRSKFGCSIDFEQSKEVTTKITLHGLLFNMEHCQKQILFEVKKWNDITKKELLVPKKHKGALIGQQGALVKRLTEKYSVSIQFQDNSDFVVIEGPSRGCNKCFEEMEQYLDFLVENSHTIVKKIPIKYIARIIGKNGKNINEIKDDYGIEINFSDSSKEAAEKGLTELDLEIIGTKKDIKEAEAKIDAIIKNVDDFVEKTLKVDPKYYKYIIGPSGCTMREIMSKSGADDLGDGPKVINIPSQRGSEDEESDDCIRIQGPVKVVDKVIVEIKKIVDLLAKRVTKNLDLPKEQYGLLIGPGGLTLRELERKFNCSIDIPNKNETSPDKKVEIVGLEEDVDKCISKINKDIVGNTQDLEILIPSKYHAFVSQHGAFEKNLSISLQVFIRHGDKSSKANSLIRNDLKKVVIPVEELTKQNNGKLTSLVQEVESDSTVADESEEDMISWKLNYEPMDFSEILGELSEEKSNEKSKDEILEEASSLIEERLKMAREPQYYGFIYAPNASNFGRIVGPGGSEINLIRSKSGSIIEIPKKTDKLNNIITLKGTKESIEKSIELIMKKLK